MHLPILFHLATEVFQLVMRYFTFPMRFQLNSDFSHTFLMGNLRAVLLTKKITHISAGVLNRPELMVVSVQSLLLLFAIVIIIIAIVFIIVINLTD